MTTEPEAPKPVAEESTPAEDLVRAMRRCTPKERKWLKALPKYDYQRWRAAKEIGLSSHTLHRMLRQERVQRALALMETMAIEELGITHRRILTEYARLAFSDLRLLHDKNGALKAPHEWDDDAAAAVAERGFNENGLPKIKLHDKKGALDALAKYRQMNPADRLELTGKDGKELNTAPPIIQIVRYGDAKATGDGSADPS